MSIGRWLWLAVLPALLVAACAPPAQPTQPEAKPEELSEWERVLAAAQQEGVVTVIGLEGDATREALTRPFEEEYGIRVEFQSASGREVVPRVTTEREAGQYLWDVYVLGTTTMLTSLIPMGALDPIEPALILPEVTDPSNWRGGGIEFLGPDNEVIVMTPFQRGTLFVNPELVDPEQFTSYRDLLDPQWRGQMIMNDPRRAGPGQATFTFFYLHPELGPDFIRELGQQDITILQNFSQEVDLLGRGAHPILIGTADAIAEARMEQGVPIHIVDPRQLAEGSDVSPANGALALFNNAPNPNAAKVYINWLLGQQGQTEFARASGFVSARMDVPTDHAAEWRIPQTGAIGTYDEEAIRVREELLPLLEEVFGPA